MAFLEGFGKHIHTWPPDHPRKESAQDYAWEESATHRQPTLTPPTPQPSLHNTRVWEEKRNLIPQAIPPQKNTNVHLCELWAIQKRQCRPLAQNHKRCRCLWFCSQKDITKPQTSMVVRGFTCAWDTHGNNSKRVSYGTAEDKLVKIGRWIGVVIFSGKKYNGENIKLGLTEKQWKWKGQSCVILALSMVDPPSLNLWICSVTFVFLSLCLQQDDVRGKTTKTHRNAKKCKHPIAPLRGGLFETRRNSALFKVF